MVNWHVWDRYGGYIAGCGCGIGERVKSHVKTLPATLLHSSKMAGKVLMVVLRVDGGGVKAGQKAWQRGCWVYGRWCWVEGVEK